MTRRTRLDEISGQTTSVSGRHIKYSLSKVRNRLWTGFRLGTFRDGRFILLTQVHGTICGSQKKFQPPNWLGNCIFAVCPASGRRGFFDRNRHFPTEMHWKIKIANRSRDWHSPLKSIWWLYYLSQCYGISGVQHRIVLHDCGRKIFKIGPLCQKIFKLENEIACVRASILLFAAYSSNGLWALIQECIDIPVQVHSLQW